MSIIRRPYTSRWIWALTGTVLGAGVSGELIYRQHHAHVMEPSGSYCDNGIGAARARAATALTRATATASSPTITQAAWIPKINDSKPPGPAPAGMTWIP